MIQKTGDNKLNVFIRRHMKKLFIFSIGIFCCSGLAINIFLASPWGGIVSASCRWDCTWYLDIAHHGYSIVPRATNLPSLGISGNRPDVRTSQIGMANWAFFPLYPALTALFAYVTKLNVALIALMINIVLWPAVIWLCGRDLYVRGLTFNPILLALAFVLYPLNIWYTAQYSEALYGVLLMLSILLLRKHEVGKAALCCGFLALARPTGFIIGVTLSLWWGYLQYIDKKEFRDILKEILLITSLSGAGLSLYVLYLYYLMGDGFAFMHIEAAWNRHFRVFLFTMFHGFTHIKHLTDSLFAILGSIIIWIMSRYKMWRLNALLLGITGLLALSTGITSIGRYIFANPLMIEFLTYKIISYPLIVRLPFLVVLAILHILTTIFWFRGSPIFL